MRNADKKPNLELSGVIKCYGRVKALDGVDLTVAAGEVLGFIGPNGAGKTTTLRILMGMLRADAGEAKIFGKDAWRDAVELHRRIAYVPGDVHLWPNLTGGEVIDLLLRLRRAPYSQAERNRWVEQFDLDPSKKCRAYSKGNRQKIALIAALSADADLFLFDEPTSGLDPLMEQVFREAVRSLRAQGKSVLLSSHILSEVETLCDRVSIIRCGKIIESGTLSQLRHLTRSDVVAQVAHMPQDLADWPIHDVTSATPSIPASDALPNASAVTLRFRVDSDRTGEVLERLSKCGVQSIEWLPPTLEELFMTHYRGGEYEGRI